jgi:DNA ligase D-like protein (predicted 3'-phosphoesterase)
LDKYRSMRDFTRTPEPSGGSAATGAPTFVIQKHAATALHYDFRLQVDDVMPSWAVPRGPSHDPKVRRLAVQTEDHPLDYQTFEGVIPRGEYGGGEVIVWDRGTYERVSHKPGPVPDMRTSIEQGHFTVMLHGEKLVGEWSLIRTGSRNGKDNWMMIKHKDEYVDEALDIETERPESVLTGRTIEDIRNGVGEQRIWHSDGGEAMLCIATRNKHNVQLQASDGTSLNDDYPTLIESLRALPVDDFVFHVEIVEGREENTSPRLRLVDVRHLLGQDTTPLNAGQRRHLLQEVVAGNEELSVV